MVPHMTDRSPLAPLALGFAALTPMPLIAIPFATRPVERWTELLLAVVLACAALGLWKLARRQAN